MIRLKMNTDAVKHNLSLFQDICVDPSGGICFVDSSGASKPRWPTLYIHPIHYLLPNPTNRSGLCVWLLLETS